MNTMNRYDLNLKLIQAVEKHDCIYNVKSAQYKKFAFKEHLWNTIGKEIGISSKEAKSNWKSVRDSYKRYKNKTNATNGYLKKYKYAEALKFLDQVVSYRPHKTFTLPTSDVEVSTELSSEEEFIYEQSTNGQTESNFDNCFDEIQDFSDTTSTKEVKAAAENIATDTSKILPITLNKDENLTTEEKNGYIDGPNSSNSSDEDSMEQTKEKDLNKLLIEEVKKHDCIYNPQSRRYKHFSYKKHLWHKIGKRFGLLANVANKKWKSIKDSYRKSKIKLITQSGFVKPYKYSECLKFLDDYIECLPSLNRMVNEPEVSTDLSSDCDMLMVNSRKLKRRKTSCGKIPTNHLNSSSEENIESEQENQKTMTSRLFMVLANKVNEANLTSQQTNAIEFGVSSFVYSKLAEYIKK
ncbi:Transcription factor Adf-1 [Lucilia cuprina]|nr:Transcription factor Adf-1 [Lucilia cuprina]